MSPLSSTETADLFFNKVFPISYGFILSRSIYAIIKLGVADALGETPLSIAAIAQKQGLKHPGNLERLMNFLASRGIFSKSDSGSFFHTSMSRDLVWECSGKKIVHYHDLRWDKLAVADEAGIQALEDGEAPSTQIEQLSRLFVQARAIHIACCLNIFEKIQNGQLAPKELQKQLEQTGLVTHNGLTDLGALMLERNCRAFILHDNEVRWKSFGRLEEAIREGTIPFEELKKSTFFEDLQTQPEALQVFSDAMTFISEYESRRLAPSLANFIKPSMTVMDVGGGKGQYLQEILTLYPEAQGILFDMPENTKAASLDEAIRPRCSFVGGNFFEQVPTADVYLFKRVLHDWSDEECIKILQTCAASAKTNSRLILNEFLLPQTEALMIDTFFIPLLKGRQRTEKEFIKILEEAGWNIESCETTACWLGQIVATKADK